MPIPSVETVATAAALALQADKLICLTDGCIVDNRKRLIRELTLEQAESILSGKNKLSSDLVGMLTKAITACTHGVQRVHLIDRQIDGGLLQELFTRDGIGTLLTADAFEGTRQARVEDIGGILELIEPMEKQGMLVRRSREQLELEIDQFIVMERDGMIIACAALYPSIKDKVGELACLAVHTSYQDQGRGDALLDYIQRRANQLGINRVFVRTTQTAHWFRERGFKPTDIKTLPVKRRNLYNYRRSSRLFVKTLDT